MIKQSEHDPMLNPSGSNPIQFQYDRGFQSHSEPMDGTHWIPRKNQRFLVSLCVAVFFLQGSLQLCITIDICTCGIQTTTVLDNQTAKL